MRGLHSGLKRADRDWVEVLARSPKREEPKALKLDAATDLGSHLKIRPGVETYAPAVRAQAANNTTRIKRSLLGGRR